MNVTYTGYPFPLSVIMAALQAALSFAQVRNIASVSFKSRAKGGILGDSDFMFSPFTPSGDDVIAGYKFGEYVVNRDATRQYLPLLQAINEQRTPQIKPMQAGGIISDQEQTSVNATIDVSSLVKAIQTGIVKGFDDSLLEIKVKGIVEGSKLRLVLDNYDNLKVQSTS